VMLVRGRSIGWGEHGRKRPRPRWSFTPEFKTKGLRTAPHTQNLVPTLAGEAGDLVACFQWMTQEESLRATVPAGSS
jgi:hypothetical protein